MTIDAETARGLFVISVLLALAIAKTLHVAYQRGRRDAIHDHFTATLPRDDSVRQRL